MSQYLTRTVQSSNSMWSKARSVSSTFYGPCQRRQHCPGHPLVAHLPALPGHPLVAHPWSWSDWSTALVPSAPQAEQRLPGRAGRAPPLQQAHCLEAEQRLAELVDSPSPVIQQARHLEAEQRLAGLVY